MTAENVRARVRTVLHHQGGRQGHRARPGQVYGFVKQSGGQVVIDSELGVGTTFSLELPALGLNRPAIPSRRIEAEPDVPRAQGECDIPGGRGRSRGAGRGGREPADTGI